MKLLKTLAIMLFAFILVAFTGCTTNFCSDQDKENIVNQIVIDIETNTKEDIYHTIPTAEQIAAANITVDGITNPEWSDLSNEKKLAYAEDVYKDNHPKACLVMEDHIDTKTGAVIEKKSFGYAFKQGLLEILAFPVAWGFISIGNLLGGSGAALMFAVILVTFIIRAALLGATWKSTKQSQKLQQIQPELNAITAKYANRNDEQSKAARSQEMMKLYKKYKINPISSLISPFLTLPVFIAIYGAVKDAAIIQESYIFGVQLGMNTGDMILKFNWFAILIFIIMAVCQFLSMKLPQWLSRRKMNATQKQQAINAASQQNAMSYIFLIMIVVIGWMLPIAMAIYWIASSLFSIVQAIVTQKSTEKAKHKAGAY